MSIRHHTIIFVPHQRAKLRKWRITNTQIGIVLASFALVTLVAAYVTYSFFTTTVDLNQLSQLKEENLRLREVNQAFESSISKIERQLSDYEDRTRQLAIVAGIEALESNPAGAGGDGDVAFFPSLGAAGRRSEAGVGGGNQTIPLGADGEIQSLARRAGAVSATLSQVEESLEEQQNWISRIPAVAPVRGVVTSRFGLRRDPISGDHGLHRGIDISAPPGKPVLATADGLVTHAGRMGYLGKAVYLSHGYGLSTRYGHLSKIGVREGQRVRRGDVLGYVGNTGRSTGFHLHYEVRLDGKAQNPHEYILDSLARR